MKFDLGTILGEYQSEREKEGLFSSYTVEQKLWIKTDTSDNVIFECQDDNDQWCIKIPKQSIETKLNAPKDLNHGMFGVSVETTQEHGELCKDSMAQLLLLNTLTGKTQGQVELLLKFNESGLKGIKAIIKPIKDHLFVISNMTKVNDNVIEIDNTEDLISKFEF